MADMVLPNNGNKIKSALAKLSKQNLEEVEKNTSLIDNLEEVVKDKFGPKEIDEAESDVSPEEQQKKASAMVAEHLVSINNISKVISNELHEIHSSLNSVNSHVNTINSLLASSAVSLLQVNAVLSAFRADYIALNNGVDIKGESYINKALLKRNTLSRIGTMDSTLKTILNSANKVSNFADLMSNGVRPKIGNTKMAKEGDGQGIFSKLLGKLSPDLAEYGELAMQFLPIIETFTGRSIDDSNIKSLASSILGKQKSKQYIDPLNEMIGQWMNGPSNGKAFDIKKLLGGKINELTGLGDDTKKLEREKNPKKVFVALAPLADDIRDMVEAEYEAYKATPKALIKKAPYATPVWIVNDPYQENGLDQKDQKDTREKDTILKRFAEMLMGRTTNKKDSEGRDLFSIDKTEGMMDGELLKKYLKAQGLEEASYNEQFQHVTSRQKELKQRIEKKRRSGMGDSVRQNANGEWELIQGNSDKLDALSGMKFDNIDNLLAFMNPIQGGANAIAEMGKSGQNPLKFVKNTLGGSVGEIGNLFSTVFSGHQSGRTPINGKGDTLIGATVHEGEIIKSEANTNITNAIKNLNIVLSATLSAFQSNSFLSRIKSQLLYQTQKGEDIDISALEKPEKPDVSKAAINETGKTDAKAIGKSGVSTIFSSVKDFISKLKPKPKKQVHKKLKDLFNLDKKPEEEKKVEEEEEEKDKDEEENKEDEEKDKNEEEEKPEDEEKDKNEEEEKPEDEEKDKDKSSAEPTEPVDPTKDEDKSKAEATDPNADAQERVEEEKSKAEADADAAIEENKAAAEERVSKATAEADEQAQQSIQEAQEKSKAEADNKIAEIKDEMAAKVDSEREAAESDADAAREERRKGEEKRNKIRDKSAEHVANKEKDVPNSKISEIIAKIKKAGSTVIEKIKNSTIGKKIASAWTALTARIAERRAGAAGREGMKKTSLIKRIIMKLTGKSEIAAGEVASEQANMAIDDAAEGPSLISELTGAVSGAVAKITDAIPFPPGVGKIAAAAIGVAAAAGIVGAGIAFLKKIKSGKKGGGDSSNDSKAKKDAQKQAKDAKKDAEKKKKQEDKKEESKAEATSNSTNIDSEISKSKAESEKKNNEGVGKSSATPMNPILSLFSKAEQKLMGNVMNSAFGKEMMKDPSKTSGFMFNMQAGDKMGFKNATTSALSKLSKGAAKIGSGFTEAMFALTNKLIKDKKKYTDDLSDKTKEKSENASLEYSKANLAKAARNITDKMLKKYDLDVIEGKSLSQLKSQLYLSKMGQQPSNTTASPATQVENKEKAYINKYKNLSDPYNEYLNDGKDKHDDFRTWLPTYYKGLIDEYGISANNSSNLSDTTEKKLSDEMNKDFYKDLTSTPEWLLLDKDIVRSAKDDLEKLGFIYDDWIYTTSNAEAGKSKYGMSIFGGLGRQGNDYLGNEFLNASSYALKNNYKEKNGGTYPGFFNSYLSKSGINVKNGISNDEIKKRLSIGKPVILMGSDTYESGKTPFGSEPHYVVATGYDGRNISIEDPDEPMGSMVYNANSVLSNSSIKLGTDDSDTPINTTRRSYTSNSPSRKVRRSLKSYSRAGKAKPKKIRVKNNNSRKQRKNNPFRIINRNGKGKYGRSKYGKGYSNTVWVGDSRTVLMGLNANVETVASKSGEMINYFVNHYSDITSKVGYNIVCWYGVNGAGESHAKSCATAYNKLAEDMKGKSDIYVCTIGLCYNDSGSGKVDGGGGQSISSFNEEIKKFNEVLVPMLDPSIKVIDLYSYIDQLHSELGTLTRDNLHYEKKACLKIKEYVDQCIQNGGGIVATTTNIAPTNVQPSASVEWSMKSYLNEDELQQFVTSKGKYTRAYEEALAAAQGKQNEEESTATVDESISGEIPEDTLGTSTAMPSTSNASSPSTAHTPSQGNTSGNGGVPSNTDINNIINNINVVGKNNLGTTIVKNDIKHIDPEDMKDILAYFKELNNIQDDSLDVLEVIYEKLRKKKGKPKENFNIGPELIGTHGRRYGI